MDCEFRLLRRLSLAERREAGIFALDLRRDENGNEGRGSVCVRLWDVC